MPHKRNPITCERVTGLARLLRGYAVAALENVALWHERDITHSSVERVILPDAFITLDYQIDLMYGILDGLIVYPERMAKNLDRAGGIVFSQRVLLALTQSGLSREEAYRLVQRNAHRAWEEDGSFRRMIEADPDVKRHLSVEALDACFDLKRNLRHVNDIYLRVLGDLFTPETYEDDA